MRTSQEKGLAKTDPQLTRPADGAGVVVRVARRFRADPPRVFHAWLDPRQARSWLFATALRPMAQVKIEPRVGGLFRFIDRADGETVRHSGRYLEIVPSRRLVFSLSGKRTDHRSSRVSVELLPRSSGCFLTLTHEAVAPREAEHTKGRWMGMLYGLALLLEAQA